MGGGTPPPPGRPACAQPLSPRRQTDSNRPQPLWQPPPTACLTAAEAASEAPSLPTDFFATKRWGTRLESGSALFRSARPQHGTTRGEASLASLGEALAEGLGADRPLAPDGKRGIGGGGGSQWAPRMT